MQIIVNSREDNGVAAFMELNLKKFANDFLSEFIFSATNSGSTKKSPTEIKRLRIFHYGVGHFLLAHQLIQTTVQNDLRDSSVNFLRHVAVILIFI